MVTDPFASHYDEGQSDADNELVDATLRLFSQMQFDRNVFGAQWEEVAELILPTSRNTFYYGNYNFPGQKKTDRQIDASGMMALGRFGAICDSLLTPRNMFWHGITAEGGTDHDYVMKDRATRLWFEKATKCLFHHRYAANANFSSQNYQNYLNLGAFGNAGMFIEQFWEPWTNFRGVRYKAVPLGELFYTQNHQGLVDGFIRWFRLTARQVMQKWPENFPQELRAPLEQDSQYLYDILHHVGLRSDYHPFALDDRALPYFSRYVSMPGRRLLGKGGYRRLPIAVSRYDQTPGETYGRSPAMMVLPALKTLNAQKRTFLKQGHRAADPVLLTADDGLVDFNLRPGAVNPGGVSPDGKPLVAILPTGQIQISEKMMAEEKSLINDAFLVTLFQILQETPQMTATEVIERTNEKGILLAPTVGRQQSEYLGPMIERELDVLSYLRLLPPMPPRLKEAGGRYQVVYTSPLSRAMRAQQAAGFMRTLETVKELVQITQDTSLLDPFDFDVAVPAIADIQAVPASWMADENAVARKRQQRAKAQQAQQQIQAAPAQAAMMKAQAAQAKAGMGGGAPQGQQPQGQPPGQPQQQPGLAGP